MIMVGSMVKLPLLMLSPGPTYNTIGEVDGEPLITITGTTTYPTDGELDMITISERGGSSGGVYLGEALARMGSPGQSVFPRESIYGPRPPVRRCPSATTSCSPCRSRTRSPRR